MLFKEYRKTTGEKNNNPEEHNLSLLLSMLTQSAIKIDQCKSSDYDDDDLADLAFCVSEILNACNYEGDTQKTLLEVAGESSAAVAAGLLGDNDECKRVAIGAALGALNFLSCVEGIGDVYTLSASPLGEAPSTLCEGVEELGE